ncbi:hypothetical protein RhiJN_00332 [Ceratobasidium sp. AG-Ba]|nr:hypothetical protein RhiJN_00332 [Ceratobasidium sp. AG-Ba]QRW01360.1 hypothetical protein RhiLY_00357 [Ceratobasidium sp. AG-Ba]
MAELNALHVMGHLDVKHHLDLFSSSRLQCDKILHLRRLEVGTRTSEILIGLWNTSLVSRLEEVVVHQSRFDDNEAASFFPLLVERSPQLTALSVPLSPNCFDLSLLDTLSPLALRKLALDGLTVDPPAPHPTILQYVGSLWPELEYLYIPFELNLKDLFGIATHLPRLQHLIADIPYEQIESTVDIPSQPLWSTPPSHALLLWTKNIKLEMIADESKSKTFEMLSRILAVSWPHMKILVEGGSFYFQILAQLIGVHSWEFVQDSAAIADARHSTFSGFIGDMALWAHVGKVTKQSTMEIFSFK